MNKVILAEIAVLLVLLVLAFCLGTALISGNAEPAMNAEGNVTLHTQQTEDSQATTEETTEPAPTWMTFPADRQLLAQQYFVYDCQSESFVTISGSLSNRIYPASITKLFTCYIALQYLEPEQQITVGDELDMVAAGSSVAELEKGDVLTTSQLVEAMLLPSGNDAAYVLAAAAGRKICGNADAGVSTAVEAFMTEMNAQAQTVGMTGTHFSNPDGIHRSEHYTCFADLAILGKLSLENETIVRNAVISSDSVTLDGREEALEWHNTNALIDPVSPYYCPYAIGLKTGQTPSAGSCLLSAFAYEGKQYIIGVFGCPETDDRFDDTLQLFNETIGIQ